MRAKAGTPDSVGRRRTRPTGVWNDVRNASDCPAVDAYRQSLSSGSPITKPSPCQTPQTAFGNTDIYGWTSLTP